MFSKVHSIHRKDLKSFIMDILLNKPDKFIEQYDLGRFDFIIWGVIRNQYYSKTSPFRRKFLYSGNKPTLQLDNNNNGTFAFDTVDKNRKIFFSDEEEDEFDAELEIIKIKSILSNIHWSKATLFKMYYFDKLTYREISEKTGIYYLKIRQSVMTTLEEVKVKLNNL